VGGDQKFDGVGFGRGGCVRQKFLRCGRKGGPKDFMLGANRGGGISLGAPTFRGIRDVTFGVGQWRGKWGPREEWEARVVR